MENFYKTLYSSQISEDTFNDSAPLFLNCKNIKRLDGEQQKTSLAKDLLLKKNTYPLLNCFRKIKPQVLTDSLRNFVCVFGIMLQFL